MFNFEKQRFSSYAECPQESNGVIRFSVRGLERQKITFERMASQLGVPNIAERNVTFGVKNWCIDLKFCTIVGVG